MFINRAHPTFASYLLSIPCFAYIATLLLLAFAFYQSPYEGTSLRTTLPFV